MSVTAEVTWSGTDVEVVRAHSGASPCPHLHLRKFGEPAPVSWTQRGGVRSTELRLRVTERPCSNATSLLGPSTVRPRVCVSEWGVALLWSPRGQAL